MEGGHDNVKTTKICMFIGVMACGLISGRTPLHAQPGSAPATSAPAPAVADDPTVAGNPTAAGNDDKPWNRGVPGERREAARALFLEGNRLFKVPLFTRAAEKYTAALSQWKHPAFYFNLALAQVNLGQDVEAHESLEQALRYGEEPLGPEQFQEAKKQLQEVERQLGRIRVTCQTQGADVTLDGATLFTGPGRYEGWVKARDHEITAKKPDYLAQARRVTVSPGKLQEVDLRLVTLSEAADTGRRWAVWKPWSVVVTGAAIAAGGAVLHALAAREFDDYDKQFRDLPCAKADPPRCLKGDTEVKDLNGQLKLARREQAIAVGSYIAGGSLIATGVVLLYLNRPRLLEQGAPISSARRVTVVPVLSGGMFGILATVSH